MNQYDIFNIVKGNKGNNLIDVGCHNGDFLKECPLKFDFTIGIDPLEFDGNKLYDVYLQKTINISNNIQDFTIYENLGCSSLNRMKSENVTHDISERMNKWYVGFPIQKVKQIVKTESIPLEFVIDEYFIEKDVTLLKIDAQGADINVVQSAGKYLHTNKIKYVYMELPSRDFVLYDNQPDYKTSVKMMSDMGFRLLHKYDFELHHSASPEANCLFKNKLF